MKTIAARIDISWKTFFAGSAVSLLLHVSVLLLVSVTLRGCQKASFGEAGGEPFRNVGLFVVDGVDGGLADAGVVPGAGESNATQEAIDQASEDNRLASSSSSSSSERVPTEAPDISTLLNLSPNENSNDDGSASVSMPPLIGPGDPIGGIQRPRTGGASLIKPSEAGGAARIGGTGGPGETTFMDIAGVGKTFVYLIDTSSSMHGSRLKVAQSQLKASLRLLQPNQKFAVIFYNDEYRTRMQLRPQPEEDMYFATDFNKELAAREVNKITSDRGTDHLPAILEALSLKPDVLYFLTDGLEPELSASDLAVVRRAAGRTTIHVIKFGDGTMSSRTTSWLELLARQGEGEFREIKAAQ